MASASYVCSAVRRVLASPVSASVLLVPTLYVASVAGRKCLLGDAMLAAPVRDRLLTLLRFPQDAVDLFIREPPLLHVEPAACAEILTRPVARISGGTSYAV
jgi:hypothetical protein